MLYLDIIYDVTTDVTLEERKTHKQVIYQTTSLPSFVTFDAFYSCLWPKILSFERYLGEKALATDHRVHPSTHPPIHPSFHLLPFQWLQSSLLLTYFPYTDQVTVHTATKSDRNLFDMRESTLDRRRCEASLR